MKSDHNVSMIWIVDIVRTRLLLEEVYYDLDVPIVIEIEYQLDGREVLCSSVSKVYYNRPLLVKEASSRSEEELDALVDKTIQRAVHIHFTSKGYSLRA
ncbi:MAG: hypothetical protein FJ139_03240 [Deltaproteobacteria bacterium]|nr:hypothetical protein [Deltaproteobacteria bacterium]